MSGEAKVSSIKAVLRKRRDGKDEIGFEMTGEAALAARLALAQEFYLSMPQLRGAARMGATVSVALTEAMCAIMHDALALYLATQAAELVEGRASDPGVSS